MEENEKRLNNLNLEQIKELKKQEIEKIKERRRKKKFGIKRRMTMMGVFPAVFLVIVLLIFATNSLSLGLYDESLNGLYLLAESVEAGYNALDGSYSLSGNNLMKGKTNITTNLDLIDSFTEDSDVSVTICYGKTRMATSLQDKAGNRITGTDIADAVWNTVSKGDIYKTKDIVINDTDYVAVYVPLRENGKIVGTIFAGQPATDVKAYINGRVAGFTGISIVLLIILTITTYITARHMAKPIVQAEDIILELAHGNLNVEVAPEVVNRNDEIGDMGKSVQQLVEKLSEIVGNIAKITDELNATGQSLSSAAAQSSSASDEISSAVEDISKGAVSQAEDIESASTQIGHMGEVIGEIVENVTTLTGTAADMGKAGDESLVTIDDLATSNDTTNKAILEIADQIKNTDESIKKISNSTALITGIAEQTNLLSLNASIESARAGEAGKGFAVVASEIQKLAVQSNDAAMEIQGIIGELLHNSQEMLTQMDDAIVLLKDQKAKLDNTKTKVGQVGDGIKVSQSGTAEIKVNADSCDSARSSVVDIITNLSAISEENAASAQETTASMEELNATINTLAEEAEKLDNLSKILREDMNFFTV